MLSYVTITIIIFYTKDDRDHAETLSREVPGASSFTEGPDLASNDTEGVQMHSQHTR